jgi:thioredoxin reductase (NADPH)
LSEAIFLRSYTRDITLISPGGKHGLRDEETDRLGALGILIDQGPLVSIELEGDQIKISTPDKSYHFASVYPALGSEVRSKLAADAGASLSGEGCVIVDRHQRTDIKGLYAAGDVVIGLDQISHAMGQAGVAATAIRNDLSHAAVLVR